MEWYYAEGKEQKGPVSEEQFTELLRTGVIQQQTLVWREGMTAWKPYGQVVSDSQPSSSTGPALLTTGVEGNQAPQVPEPFSGVNFGGAENQREAALAKVKAPAICLIIYACLMGGMALLSLLGVMTNAGMPDLSQMDPEVAEMVRKMQGPVQLATVFLTFVVAAVVLFGGLQMLKLKSYGLAIAASICACLPCACPCCFIGIGFGIWSLMVLNQPDVKGQFN